MSVVTPKSFVEELYQKNTMNLKENHSLITVRLQPHYAIMFKLMSKGLDFPMQDGLENIISKALYDICVSLDDNTLNELNEHLKNTDSISATSVGLLRQVDALSKPDLLEAFVFTKKENIKGEDNGSC